MAQPSHWSGKPSPRTTGTPAYAYNKRTAAFSRLRIVMAGTFKIGGHVSWNSEAGRVRGRIVRVHTHDVTWKGYVHHASPDEPQYEIKSDKTDHVAMHKPDALTKIK